MHTNKIYSTDAKLPENPFSKVSLPDNPSRNVSLPDEVTTRILSFLPRQDVQEILETCKSRMGAAQYNLHRQLLENKTKLTGKELEQYQRLFRSNGKL